MIPTLSAYIHNGEIYVNIIDYFGDVAVNIKDENQQIVCSGTYCVDSCTPIIIDMSSYNNGIYYISILCNDVLYEGEFEIE